MEQAGAELARLGVATAYEAAGRRGLLAGEWIQLVPGSAAAGRALPVRCAQDDNLAVHAALDRARAGEVLVLSMPRPAPVALVGDLLATQGLARGLAAILVDAAVRDSEALARIGLPIWARAISARGAAKRSAGTVGEPVEVGGVAIAAGDHLVLDRDGAVAVPAARAEEVLDAARARARREESLARELRAGASTLDLLDLRRLVAGGSDR